MIKKWFSKKWLIILSVSVLVLIVGVYPGYLLAQFAFNRYFEHWGNKLVDLENRGLLSKQYGAGWQDVLVDRAMAMEASRIMNTGDDSEVQENDDTVQVVDGIVLADYPSLSIIDQLRQVKEYSSIIEIVDRKERPLSRIKTDHSRASISEFPPVLITALIASEDGNFRKNHLGFEFKSFVRAALQSVWNAVFTFKKSPPRGTSTITQQVAKLFISRLDEYGMRQVSRSVDRKIRELRIAVALRKLYGADDILEVYFNHCVTSDYGMIGFKDIAKGLFNRELRELSDAECIYLARMVKWGRNIKSKIVNQCKVDMPRMAEALGWDEQKQREVLEEVSELQFQKPLVFQGEYGPLVDLANDFWLLTLKKKGSGPQQLEQMDIIDPNSLIRKKGNLRIQLTIDLPLQQTLQKLVDSRGYGPDTTIIDEVRIGSRGETVISETPLRDTIRAVRILKKPVDFSEPNSAYITSLNPGDTVIVNVRYKKTGKNEYRRSCFYYVKRPVIVNGQYYAYSIMDSKTGELLAYYSKDRLGSRLACLLRNRVPNGSSTAKPIFNALNFDLGIFKPYSKWTDEVAVPGDVPWKRELNYNRNKLIGVIYKNSAVRGKGYPVHNHNYVFDGCQYVFDHLNASNNILAVETAYRLNQRIFDENGDIIPEAFPLVQYFYRVGAFSRIKDSLNLKDVTGVRAYKELCRIVGVDVDTMLSYGKRMPVSDSMYSVALGTLEMSLYEQMHIFNILYNNDLIEKPARHPSLVIKNIVLNESEIALDDTVKRYHPFMDINNIRPTLLGLHKRLVSNKWDGLERFDIPYVVDPFDPVYWESSYNEFAYEITEPMSNFAKSGTTDDVIRPFNVSASSKKRTNYGLWNAVLRVDLSKLSGEGDPDTCDITVACVGECNTKFTGPRDGKSLHKFLTTGLLKKAGVGVENGYFSRYESYLRKVTPADEDCSNYNEKISVDSLSVISVNTDSVVIDSVDIEENELLMFENIDWP